MYDDLNGTIMKSQLKKIITTLIRMISRTGPGRFVENALIDEAMAKVTTVIHQGCKLYFTTPNPLTRWRGETYSSKEPETLDWIDRMAEGQVLWDIGANVGLYSIYAAKHRKLRVFSFEPSVFNLELLGRNSAYNAVTDLVTIIPLALSDVTGPNLMRHSTTAWGGALSSFGADFGADGKKLESQIEYTTFGVTADELVEKHNLAKPDHIKIDVDGIEHLILAGAKTILKTAQTVLVEINEEFTEQAEVAASILTAAGFVLQAKEVSIFTTTGEDGAVHNQIWIRS